MNFQLSSLERFRPLVKNSGTLAPAVQEKIDKAGNCWWNFYYSSGYDVERVRASDSDHLNLNET